MAENLEKFKERIDIFNERDKFAYERNGSEPGKIIIFNNEKERAGSRRDVIELIGTFQRLGLNIAIEDIHSDKRKDEIIDIIKRAAGVDYTEYNSLMVFFCSHGDTNNELITVDGYTITVDELYTPFANCKTLRNKPKMFVIQACKGEKFTSVDKRASENKVIAPRSTFSLTLPKDLLLVYSTLEGNVALRTFYGSWFIQELCKNFISYGRRDDVFSLLIRTTKCVCRNYYTYDNDKQAYKKQMPLIVSTLTKKFYVNTNKDRSILLKVSHDLDEIKKLLAKLEKQKK